MRILFLASLALAAIMHGGATAARPTHADSPRVDTASVRSHLLITSAALARHLHDPDLVLLHVGDAKAYKAAHIPGARLVTLSDIDADNGKLALEMPTAAVLRKRLAALGIGDHSRIVVYYGTDWVSPATRVMFTLQAAGLGAHARLLDGNMQLWRRQGHPVTDQPTPTPAPGTLGPLHLHAPIVDAAFVRAHARQRGYVLIDARTPDYYDGSKQSGDRAHLRRGHIPGARNLPFNSVFNDDLGFKTRDQLLALFRHAGFKRGDHVIVYCHIGQQATAVVFAARLAGIDAQLYDGSFQDWSIRDLPVAR